MGIKKNQMAKNTGKLGFSAKLLGKIAGFMGKIALSIGKVVGVFALLESTLPIEVAT